MVYIQKHWQRKTGRAASGSSSGSFRSALRGQERRLDRLREMGVWQWPRLTSESGVVGTCSWDSKAATAAPAQASCSVGVRGRASQAGTEMRRETCAQLDSLSARRQLSNYPLLCSRSVTLPFMPDALAPTSCEGGLALVCPSCRPALSLQKIFRNAVVDRNVRRASVQPAYRGSHQKQRLLFWFSARTFATCA